ncbi:MAG: SURF1 family protein [Steroidobacteraceae bacterium]
MSLSFRPRWIFTLLTAVAVTAFVGLGYWQWQRGVARKASWEAFERGNLPAQPAAPGELAGLPRFTRVAVQGQWDAAHQFLLDNISHDGQPGYDVLSMLRLTDGRLLPVNRGWVPFSGYRERLPDVSLTADGSVTITGRLSTLPVAGLASGRQAPAPDGPWPRVTSFPTIDELAQAVREPLLPQVLLLDRDSGAGYLREWLPPGMSPDRHFSYAVQWWLFAAIAFGLYVALNLKVAR